jgi:hypothetical protein
VDFARSLPERFAEPETPGDLRAIEGGLA